MNSKSLVNRQKYTLGCALCPLVAHLLWWIKRSFAEELIKTRLCRIRTEIKGGAWCPNGLISPRSRQFLEIDLRDEYLITGTESQGRFANSVGVEFVESYSVEYWRSALNRWVKYKDFNGSRVSDHLKLSFSLLCHWMAFVLVPCQTQF